MRYEEVVDSCVFCRNGWAAQCQQGRGRYKGQVRHEAWNCDTRLVGAGVRAGLGCTSPEASGTTWREGVYVGSEYFACGRRMGEEQLKLVRTVEE